MMDYIGYILLAFFWLGAACTIAVGIVFFFIQDMLNHTEYQNYFEGDDEV